MTVILPKSIFLHIPKTGGMWVREALKKSELVIHEYDERHDFNKHINDQMVVDRPIRFCFVRNPITWYQSYWAMRTKDDSWDDEALVDRLCASDNFRKFIDAVIGAFPDGHLNHLYAIWVNQCTIVSKMELFPKSLINILDMCGEKYNYDAIINLPRQNIGDKKYKKLAIYSHGQKEKLRAIEHEALKIYDYGRNNGMSHLPFG